MLDQTINYLQSATASINDSLSNEFEEKTLRQLPDILRDNLDMVVVGITPSGALGISNHHFSGPGNHFWRCIYEVGIVPMSVQCEDDYKMLDFGIGFISFCTRPSKGGTELSRKEMKVGAAIMLEKIKIYKPKIVVFNGIGIYEAFLGNKNFSMGLQPNRMDGTNSLIFVMPSSSARCAQLPRAEDKIPFFVSLKKLRDHLKGELPHLEEKEVIFENYTEFRVTQPDPRSLLKAERRRKRKAEQIAETTQTEFVSESGVLAPLVETQQPDEMRHVLEHVKEEKTSVQQQQQQSVSISLSSASSLMTMNAPLMTSSPILSWPHSAGLTIIHTGQQILMPTGTQSATANTLLLFDSSGLSFSPMSMPVSQTHLQVRPMILANEAEPKSMPQPMVSFAQKSNETTTTSSANSVSSTLKIRHSSDTLKPISVKSVQKANPSLEPSKSVTTHPVPILSAPSKTDSNTVGGVTSVKTELEIPKDIPSSPVTADIPETFDIKYEVIEDPVDDWELFIKGINTGEFTYPAPPQAIPILNRNVVEEFSEVSRGTSRILTVL